MVETVVGSCRGCLATWTGERAAHCSGCHTTFSGVTGFDRHRVHGSCHSPVNLGMRMSARNVWVRALRNSEYAYV